MISGLPALSALAISLKLLTVLQSEFLALYIWKESKSLTAMKKKVDLRMAKDLLETGRTHVKGLYSPKKDKRFDADLVLEDTGKYVNLNLDFAKEGKKDR